MEKSCIIGGNIARKKITIYKENRRLDQSVLSIGFLGENKIEKIEFIVPEEYKEFSKKACFSTIDGTFSKVFDNVTSNILTIDKEITKYNELDCNIQFFKTIDDDEIIAKTSNLHLVIEDSIVCDDDVENDDPKVLILDSLIEKVTNLDKVISENETQREEYIKNLKSSVENGDFNGKDATINGFNTLNIVAGTNIDLKQENDTLEINNTYQYDDSDLVKKIDNINDNFKNYSLITETGNKLDLTIDSKTYIMTLKLKDKDDNVLSTGSVDLPIESMIINVTYDNDNEKLTFTLQNGSVIDVPLDSLISGLVNETDLKDTLKDYAKTTDVPTKVSELENDSKYVKNTDYATDYKTGVIRTGGGATLNNYGVISPAVRNYAEYNASGDTLFLSKGTFENAIAGKNLETANNKVNLVNENSTDTQYPSAKCTYEIKNNLDRLKDNVLEVGEASDTYIHVEDSSLNELKELEVEGVCEQETTTGKNLLSNVGGITQTINGITFTKNNNGTITANGTATDNINYYINGYNYIDMEPNTYYLSDKVNGESNNTYFTYYEFKNNDTQNLATYGVNTRVISSKLEGRSRIVVRSGQTLNNVVFKPMLEANSIETDFEPYTGGQASPSPDYPQEIKTITDSLKLTTCNKNLIPINFSSETKGGVTFTHNDDGSITLNGMASSSFDFVLANNVKLPSGTYAHSINNIRKGMYVSFDNSADNMLNGSAQKKQAIFKLNKEKIYSKYFIWIDKDTIFNNDTFYIQLERNSTATSFEQHLQSQITANLPEGEFIGKTDDTYKDTLKVVYKEDGKHHLVLNKIISKTVLNGTQPISYSKVINDDKFVAQFNIGTAIKSSSTMISDKFIYMSNGWASNSENISTGGSNNNLLQMKILQSRLEEISSNGLTNWLSTHPVEVYYALENPYEVDLGIVDMPLSYSGVTNIFTDSDLLPKINAKYYKDFKLSIKNYINSYIDNKLNELQSTANDVATADNTQSDENQNSDLS